jgi:hypothetical protein
VPVVIEEPSLLAVPVVRHATARRIQNDFERGSSSEACRGTKIKTTVQTNIDEIYLVPFGPDVNLRLCFIFYDASSRVPGAGISGSKHGIFKSSLASFWHCARLFSRDEAVPPAGVEG